MFLMTTVYRTSWSGAVGFFDNVACVLPILMLFMLGGLLGRLLNRLLGPGVIRQASDKFCQQREALETEFIQRAGERGIPRGLLWVKCDFEQEVHFVQNQGVGQLQALVEVTISFEAEPGGDMEGVEAVGNLRAATAVFFTDARSPGDWTTDGRAIFNLNPQQAIERFQDELTVVPEKALR